MIRVVDEKMGDGKSSGVINMINKSDDGTKFLFVTPYLSEVKRVRCACPGKEFKEPIKNEDFNYSKLRGLKMLLGSGCNIATTHALFHYFDDEVIDLIHNNNYVLVLDEVADVIRPYLKANAKARCEGITKSDLDCLLKSSARFNEATGFVDWIDDSYDGTQNPYKIDCQMHSLALYGDKQYPLWVFPYKIFEAFKECYILTYMFDNQIQKYYFDMLGLNYDFMGVSKIDGEYCLSQKRKKEPIVDYRKLIHICEKERLNRIGNRRTDLSKAWYSKNRSNPLMTQLKNNTSNFFKNICGCKSSQTIWTTFKGHRKCVQGKGYTKGFLACNIRATNEYGNRNCVAYLMNRYMNPVIRNFFLRYGVEVDEDGYALSEMLQFIWRSAIRNGEEIWIYIPSARMRNLLKQWIEDNSPKLENEVKNAENK